MHASTSFFYWPPIRFRLRGSSNKCLPRRLAHHFLGQVAPSRICQEGICCDLRGRQIFMGEHPWFTLEEWGMWCDPAWRANGRQEKTSPPVVRMRQLHAGISKRTDRVSVSNVWTNRPVASIGKEDLLNLGPLCEFLVVLNIQKWTAA